MKSEISYILDNMLYLNARNRSKKKESTCSPIQYANMFCTIVCDIGRTTGKTSYIIANATEDDIIIARTNGLKQLYKTKATVVSVHELKERGYRAEKEYTNVYVDDASQVFLHIDKGTFYDIFTSFKESSTFVFLG